jgi:malonyl-CoA/methylmalonyl-CoA synthetase
MLAAEAPDLVSLVARVAAARPDHPALVVESERGVDAWGYGRLAATADAVARELAARGVLRGDRVAVVVGNGAELVVSFLAVLACGAAMLPVNLAYRRREIAHLLVDAQPRLVIAGRDRLPALVELAPNERGGVEAILVAEELLGAAEERASREVAPFRPPIEVRRDDAALLLYTSGTTGPSKGAVLSHGNLLSMIASLHEAWRWSADDALDLTLPLFHLHGLVNGVCCGLAAGATLRLAPRFDAAAVVDRLAAGEATLFFGVPTLYVRLVEELRGRGGARFPSLRLFVSGSAPLPAETFAAFRELTGHEILERYGMSETGMLVGNPIDGPRLPGTVGVPLPGVELRLVDADGQRVAAGTEGEVEVRGPNVFSGYWRAPEKTAASFREDAEGRRWFRTGDRGRIDPEHGYLTLLGRASELILSGGFNVYPREVEEVLLRLPGVREAAVVGEPHAEFGESPVAFLVVDRALSLAELDAHCRAELAPFKLPRRYVFLDALPRNALGKVEKRHLLAP